MLTSFVSPFLSPFLGSVRTAPVARVKVCRNERKMNCDSANRAESGNSRGRQSKGGKQCPRCNRLPYIDNSSSFFFECRLHKKNTRRVHPNQTKESSRAMFCLQQWPAWCFWNAYKPTIDKEDALSCYLKTATGMQRCSTS